MWAIKFKGLKTQDCENQSTLYYYDGIVMLFKSKKKCEKYINSKFWFIEPKPVKVDVITV